MSPVSRVPIAELRKTYDTLCEMLESRICSPFTIAQVEALKASLEQEIAEAEVSTKSQGQSGQLLYSCAVLISKPINNLLAWNT